MICNHFVKNVNLIENDIYEENKQKKMLVASTRMF